MKRKAGLFIVIILLLQSFQGFTQQQDVVKGLSPNRLTSLELRTMAGRLQYRMLQAGTEVVTWSALGLQTGPDSTAYVTISENMRNSNRGKINWPLGEDAVISNDYNEILLTCSAAALDFQLVARIYDGSIAFHYVLPALVNSSQITKELTEFNFTKEYTLYQYHHETVFSAVSIDTFSTPCDLPATLTNGKLYLSIGEAANDNYTKAELTRGNQPHSLRIAFIRDAAVKIAGEFKTPWRTVSVATSAIGLHAFSQLYLKLNPPPVSPAAGVKPGKLIRAQLNTQSGLDCIDFAAKHNFQYIMFDAGWYGAEFRSSSDPTVVIPAIDMTRVIQHGKEKGIGVILYVNYVGLKAKLDTLLPLYKKWGVAGLKFGFVDGFSQAGINWLAAAIRKVNEYGFVLNIHDNYKPTGLSRTFPALLTQEGIRGDENSPDAFHTTVLPFTRFLAGPADFTFCYPNAKNRFTKNLKVSMAQQLALTVIYFSPLQSIFWYGQPNDYINEEEIEFFKYVPTVWDQSLYLDGEIGRFVSVARRSGQTWFIGSAAGLEDRQGELSFGFLTKGKQYTATIYEDDDKGSIRKSTMKVQHTTKMPLRLKAKAGIAMIVKPN